jgi:hypothetical protein
MAKTVGYYLSRAAQARRLAEGCTDPRLREDLLRIAGEFEEEARILKEREEKPH